METKKNRGLPPPLANKLEYSRILKERFELYPACKENYDKFEAAKDKGWISETVDFMPIKMDYEAGSRCNFRCTMCLMSELSEKRPPEMKFESFKKSLDEQYGLVEIKLQGLGEPLLNPDFFKMVHEAVSRKIWVRTTTNGSLLDRNENYKRMIDEGIGEIQVSIDGATKKTFEKIRIGSDFDKVVENVRSMNMYARSVGQIWRTSCWMLVQEDNIDEMEALLELAEYMGFSRLTYSLAVASWGRDDWEEKNKCKRVYDRLTNAFLFSLIEKGKQRGLEVTFWMGMEKYDCSNAGNRRLCDWLFSRAFISADMRIVPCCVVCSSKTCDVGDALVFTSAWNGETYKALRRVHINGNIPAMCKNCYL